MTFEFDARVASGRPSSPSRRDVLKRWRLDCGRARTLSRTPSPHLLLMTLPALFQLAVPPQRVICAPQQCVGEQCSAPIPAAPQDAGTVYGTEFLYDAHTVILAEGNEAEMQDPGWTGRFGMQYVAEDDTCESMGWQQRAVPRRVWDCFTFFNELDVLR